MNPLDRLLQDELHRLLDRIAACTREGVVGSAGQDPEVAARLASAEQRLADLRAALLERYGEWYEAMEECERAWTLADSDARAPSSPADLRAA